MVFRVWMTKSGEGKARGSRGTVVTVAVRLAQQQHAAIGRLHKVPGRPLDHDFGAAVVHDLDRPRPHLIQTAGENVGGVRRGLVGVLPGAELQPAQSW